MGTILQSIWEAYEESRVNDGYDSGARGGCGLALLPERELDMLEWDRERSRKRGSSRKRDVELGRYREEYDLEYGTRGGCENGFDGFGPEELDIESLGL